MGSLTRPKRGFQPLGYSVPIPGKRLKVKGSGSQIGRNLRIGALALVLYAIAAAGAEAAVKPTAVTGPVTATGSTTATVTGTVNPNGQATTWYFEYGKTTTYGTKSATTNAGAGTADVAAVASLTALVPNTTYHYRLVATNATGTSRGTDGVFATSTAIEAVTSPATKVTLTSATLNGSLNPHGRATTWYFEYGTSKSYGTKTALQSAGAGTSAIGVSASISGLTTGRTYHYRLVATNTAATAQGSDVTFSTTAVPTAVTGASTGVAATSATLNGTVNPNGQATSWYFEYGTTTGYGSTTSSKNAGSGVANVKVATSLSGLASGATYHFRLVAKSSAGTTRGADMTFATIGVSIRASTLSVVYGQRVTLSGTVSGGQAGETVTVYAQPYGESSFRSIANVITTAGGTWSYAAKPSIGTEYQASWKTAPSSHVAVGVKPLVALRTLKGARFSTHVAAGRSFARPLRQAAATLRARPVGDGRRQAAELELDRDLPPEAAAGNVEVACHDQREPGRRRLPRRHQPHDLVPPPLRRRGTVPSRR